MARKKKIEEIEDLTDIGLDVGDLKEIEVTEIEAEIEAGETKDLIEEKKGEDECKSCEQPKQEEQSSGESKKISTKESLKSDQNNDSEKSSESENLSELSEEDIVEKIRQERLSMNSKKKSKQGAKKSGARSVKPTQAKRGRSTVTPKPKTKASDPSVRSTMGLFFRS